MAKKCSECAWCADRKKLCACEKLPSGRAHRSVRCLAEHKDPVLQAPLKTTCWNARKHVAFCGPRGKRFKKARPA